MPGARIRGRGQHAPGLLNEKLPVNSAKYPAGAAPCSLLFLKGPWAIGRCMRGQPTCKGAQQCKQAPLVSLPSAIRDDYLICIVLTLSSDPVRTRFELLAGHGRHTTPDTSVHAIRDALSTLYASHSLTVRPAMAQRARALALYHRILRTCRDCTLSLPPAWSFDVAWLDRRG